MEYILIAENPSITKNVTAPSITGAQEKARAMSSNIGQEVGVYINLWNTDE